MSERFETIRIRGKNVTVPAAHIAGRTVVVTGGWLRTARIKDEELVEGTLVADPATFLVDLRNAGIRADLFTFAQGLDSDAQPLELPFELDNVAAIPTRSFDTWWASLPQETRKNARRAAKRGLSVRRATFDIDFARGIKRIYDETPVRQGRAFWHYRKPLDRVIVENETYLERSEFLGAYCDGELVGFMKWVSVGTIARILQILSMNAHQEKRPMNALMAKAVEECHAKGMTHLVYGRFTYGNNSDSTLKEFKRRMGFEQIDFPRYYVPLTAAGKLALRLGLHKGWKAALPPGIVAALVSARKRWSGLHRTKTAKREGTAARTVVSVDNARSDRDG